MKKNNFVFDTNTLISAALSPHSTNALAMKKAESLGTIVYSSATWSEFLDVLFRNRFDKYFTRGQRERIAARFLARFKKIEASVLIEECRDPKDDKFLELAVSSSAKCLVSGDSDLLVLHPFRKIPILNATDFLNTF